MEQFCRICLSHHTLTDSSFYKSPCKCVGSIELVHEECLDRWRCRKDDFFCCEICRGRYQTKHDRSCSTRTASLAQLLLQTLTRIILCTVIAACFTFFAMKPTDIMKPMSSFYTIILIRSSFLVLILFSIYAFLGLMGILWIPDLTDAELLARREALSFIRRFPFLLRPFIMPFVCLCFPFRAEYLWNFKSWTISHLKSGEIVNFNSIAAIRDAFDADFLPHQTLQRRMSILTMSTSSSSDETVFHCA